MYQPRNPVGVLALTAALAIPGCFLLGGTSGSGTEASEDRTVDAFTQVSLGGALKLEAEIGPEQKVTVISDDNIVPLIETTVSDGRLKIRTTESIRSAIGPTIRITVPSLTEIDASGATTVIASALTGESFTLETSGASKATLSGEVEQLTIDVSGASKIAAAELKTKSAKVDVSGAGKVDVTVSEELNVEVSGAGNVTYGGSPKVTQDISGAGKVEPR